MSTINQIRAAAEATKNPRASIDLAAAAEVLALITGQPHEEMAINVWIGRLMLEQGIPVVNRDGEVLYVPPGYPKNP